MHRMARAPAMVVLDSHVPFIDEVAEIIREGGGQPHPPIGAEDMRFQFPAWLSSKERSAAEARARQVVILRHEEEAVAPAAEILRLRKANRPSAVRKVVLLDGLDSSLYRAVLEGIEPDLSGLVHPPAVTSLALRVSGAARNAVKEFHGCAVIAGADQNIFAMYLGDARPAMPSDGCYLVYDSVANSLAAIPQLPPSVTWFTHGPVGPGAGVLRRAQPSGGGYLLAELLYQHAIDGSNPGKKASLFTWFSSGDLACQWIHQEVFLPVPSGFYADIVFSLPDAAICWAGLFTGILLCECDPIPMAARFHFIPLPAECQVDARLLLDLGAPDTYRSACSVSSNTIKFVQLDAFGPIEERRLAVWVFNLQSFKWSMPYAPFRLVNLWSDPMYRELNLPQLMPKNPILSVLDGEDHVVYLYLADKIVAPKVETTGSYMITFDMKHHRMLSAAKAPQTIISLHASRLSD